MRLRVSVSKEQADAAFQVRKAAASLSMKGHSNRRNNLTTFAALITPRIRHLPLLSRICKHVECKSHGSKRAVVRFGRDKEPIKKMVSAAGTKKGNSSFSGCSAKKGQER
jgi:hypothetical protein